MGGLIKEFTLHRTWMFVYQLCKSQCNHLLYILRHLCAGFLFLGIARVGLQKPKTVDSQMRHSRRVTEQTLVHLRATNPHLLIAGWLAGMLCEMPDDPEM